MWKRGRGEQEKRGKDTSSSSFVSSPLLRIFFSPVLLISFSPVLLISFSPLLLLAGCNSEHSTPPPVILISIDTLRADHLPAYGYRGVETPNIDAFRDDAILYQNAYSHIPLTLPSHATILTGTHPAESGIRDNLGFTLRKDIPTIAELLKKKGYATGAAVSTFVLRQETGIARGFDFYDDNLELGTELHNLGALQRNGTETTRAAINWVTGNVARPFFLMLHLYEPHTPYQPPEPHRSRYASSPYDGEIAASDEILGSFLRFLKEQDVYERSMIIVLSDHGEGLGDHGEDEHGIFLYREAIQVPLLVKLPRSREKGRSVATPVQLSDVFATIAAVTAVEHGAVQGQSLLDFSERNRQIFSESYFGRLHFGWSELHSIIDNRHHFIHAPSPELYDLAADPAEKKNVLTESRREYAAMRKMLEPLIQEPSARQQINPEEAQKLAALGYLGSAAESQAGERADPKNKIGTLREVKIALGFFHEERDVEAVERFRKLLAESPGMLDIWDALSRSLLRLHRYEEAIEAAQQGLRLSPATSHFAVLIANASLELERWEDARHHAELVLEKEPAQAHEILARIHLANKEFDAAVREAGLALAEKRDRITALLTLARIENERNRPAAALEHCDRVSQIVAERKMDSIRRLSFHRGDALARLGRYREAEVEFHREIETFPRDPQAYKNLILLYVTQDRLKEADSLIYKLEDAAEGPPAYLAIAEVLEVVGDPAGSKLWARKGLQKYPQERRLRKFL